MTTETPTFTGEFFVPGKADARMEADHVERYRFACQYASGKSVLDIACGIGYSAPMYLEAGANDYLTKPYQELELVEKVSEMLEIELMPRRPD